MKSLHDTYVKKTQESQAPNVNKAKGYDLHRKLLAKIESIARDKENDQAMRASLNNQNHNHGLVPPAPVVEPAPVPAQDHNICPPQGSANPVARGDNLNQLAISQMMSSAWTLSGSSSQQNPRKRGACNTTPTSNITRPRMTPIDREIITLSDLGDPIRQEAGNPPYPPHTLAPPGRHRMMNEQHNMSTNMYLTAANNFHHMLIGWTTIIS